MDALLSLLAGTIAGLFCGLLVCGLGRTQWGRRLLLGSRRALIEQMQAEVRELQLQAVTEIGISQDQTNARIAVLLRQIEEIREQETK